VLQRGASTAFADIVYRSSFVYTKMDDMITFYYSGAHWDGAHYLWSGAIQRRLRGSLFADLLASGTFNLRPSRSDLPNPERSSPREALRGGDGRWAAISQLVESGKLDRAVVQFREYVGGHQCLQLSFALRGVAIVSW